jgi:predicted nucleic acid-binding Zn ribbon protein
MSVHTKVLPLCSLTALKPTSEFGQVRPGAAVPCGYPSSGFAALPEARDKRVSEETKVKERRRKMDKVNIILLIIFILLIICVYFFMKQYKRISNVEMFDSFSPYMGNESYPYVYQKTMDQKMLRNTLKKCVR